MAGRALNRVTIGSDPEFFIANNIDYKPTAACGKFGGTKGSPIPIDRYGGYLEDGCAIEINPEPQTTGFNAFKIFKHLKDNIAVKVLTPKNFIFLPNSEVEFTEDELSHPMAKVIGCAVDYDAYDIGRPRQPPSISDFGNWRFAGGHIHVGINPWPKSVPRHVFAQLMDFYMLAPWHVFDHQTLRRAQYGLPGLFRPKPYGLEYRSFSNSIFSTGWPNYETFWQVLDQLAGLVSTADEDEQTLDNLGKVYNLIDWNVVQEKLSKQALSSKDMNELKSMQRSAGGIIGLPNYVGEI